MKEYVIEIALGFIAKALNKKRGKIYELLISEETQNTLGDIYKSYLTIIDELEDD